MSERVIAIGDVHGCADALDGLLDWLAPAAGDTVVMLGDCVDRGPDSRRVIDLVIDLFDRCKVISILGNHEEMLLAAVDRPGTQSTWLQYGGRETLASYGIDNAAELPHEHLLYLRTWVDFFETSTHFFAHANYDPQTPLALQEWGFQRWESLGIPLPERHISGMTAVLGHSSQKSGKVLDAGHLVCIDTFCCGGKWLTAYDVTSRRFYQVSPDGQKRRER